MALQRLTVRSIADEGQTCTRDTFEDWAQLFKLFLHGQAANIQESHIVGVAVAQEVAHLGIPKTRVEAVSIHATPPQPDFPYPLLLQLRSYECGRGQRIGGTVEDNRRQAFDGPLQESDPVE